MDRDSSSACCNPHVLATELSLSSEKKEEKVTFGTLLQTCGGKRVSALLPPKKVGKESADSQEIHQGKLEESHCKSFIISGNLVVIRD